MVQGYPAVKTLRVIASEKGVVEVNVKQDKEEDK